MKGEGHMENENKYVIQILREKTNVVRVFEKEGEGGELVWQFPLDKNTEPIVLKTFIDDSRFMIMDWEGALWCFDVVQKSRLYFKDFQAELSSHALLSDDGKFLYLYLKSGEPRVENLAVMELSKFSIVKEFKFEHPLFDFGFWRRKDGAFLVYFLDEDEEEHGFISLDPSGKKHTRYDLSHSRLSDIAATPPWLDTENNIGVRRYYDLEIKKSGGKELFISKVAVFDLDTFRDTVIIPAREFPPEQVGTSGDEKEPDPLVEKLREAFADKRHTKAVDNFVDSINSVWFTGDGYFWICYRGGILRKIAVDGSRLSSYVLAKEKGMSSPPFMNKTFHTHIESVKEPEIVLGQHDTYYRVTLPDRDLFGKDEFIEVDAEEFDPYGHFTVSKKAKKKKEEMGLVIVAVKNTQERDDLLTALNEIEKLTRKIKKIRSGETLAFLIKDEKKSLDEKKFFNKVAEYPEALPVIRKIIDNYVSYDKHGELYMDEETTALAWAAEALVSRDPEYMESYMDYLSVIDMEHDVVNRETIIPKLLKKYRNEEAGYRLRTRFLMTDDGELQDSFYDELEKGKEFSRWFQDRENRKRTAKWMKSCFKRKIGYPRKELQSNLKENGQEEFAALL